MLDILLKVPIWINMLFIIKVLLEVLHCNFKSNNFGIKMDDDNDDIKLLQNAVDSYEE